MKSVAFIRRLGRLGLGVVSRVQSDALFRHSVLLLAAAQVGNGCNFLFQFAMMRGLPETEYGTLAALLGLVLVVAVPLESVRTAVAHGVAWARAEGIEAPRLFAWIRRWLTGAGLAGLAIGIGFALVTPWISELFHVTSGIAPVVTGWILAGSVVLAVMAGAVQGLEWFGRMAVITQIWTVARLGLALAVVFAVSATAHAALLTHLAGLTISLGIGAAVLVRGGYARKGQGCAGFAPPGCGAAAVPALLGFGILMNADIVLVKILFDPETAGHFARAATLARAVAFLPMPIALAVFPTLVQGALTLSRTPIRRAMVFTLGVSVLGTAAGLSLASPFWKLFTGTAPAPASLFLTRSLMLAMAPLGVIFTELHVLLARRRWAAAAGMVPFSLIYIGAVLWGVHSVEGVAAILAAVSAGTALALAIPCALPLRKAATPTR